MPLNAGVLIIGSLYWREDGRTRWRQKRLDMDHAWLVRAPIRYGRLSDGGTYTMVFTQLADHQLGQAKVVQCRHPVTTASDLVTEAEWLWSAELNKVPRLCASSPEHSISASWSYVALLRNAHSNVPQTLVDDWAKRFFEERASGGKHLVDSRGMLQIDWPSMADGSGPVPLDLLLGTSNIEKFIQAVLGGGLHATRVCLSYTILNFRERQGLGGLTWIGTNHGTPRPLVSVCG